MNFWLIILLTAVPMATGSFILFYLGLRLHMWREYYRHSKATPRAKQIDHGDKMLALIFALGLAFIWPIALPAYLIRRHLVMQHKRRVAGAYADRMMHRWDVEHVTDEHHNEGDDR